MRSTDTNYHVSRWIDGVHLDRWEPGYPAQAVLPRASLRLANHSPTGFEFGYTGSGPHQLALAILLDFLEDKKRAMTLYHAFTFDVIAGWTGHHPQISGAEILAFVERIGSVCNAIGGE